MLELAKARCREDLAQELRQRIRDGLLRTGDALPSERDLAERTGLARGTVRSALDQLVEEGLITCHHGRRRTVATGAIAAHTLAVLAIDPQPRPDLWQWPGLDAWLQLGMAQAAFAAGWHVLNLHPRAANVRGPSLAVAGVLVSTTAFEVPGMPELIANCAARGLAVCGVADDPALAVHDRAVHDHAAGCALLVDELLRRSVTRILPCWGHRAHLDPWYLRARSRGLQTVLRRAGLPDGLPPWRVTPWNETQDPPWSDLVAAEATALAPALAVAEPPQALMAVDDIHAFRLAAALRLLDLPSERWPLITGYDVTGRFGIPDAEPAWTPDLSVDRSNAQVAAAAVSLITARLAGALPPGPQLQLVPPARLIVG